jgi:hypothetical protein
MPVNWLYFFLRSETIFQMYIIANETKTIGY